MMPSPPPKKCRMLGGLGACSRNPLRKDHVVDFVEPVLPPLGKDKHVSRNHYVSR